MQSNPNALGPFVPQSASPWVDPTFSTCTDDFCRKSWGLRVVNSVNVLVYGAGLYSFFDNYSQTCLNTESCQTNMVNIDSCSGEIFLYGLSTKGATTMVVVDGVAVAQQIDNRDNFCSTVVVFEHV
jgi:glucan 1,3-beta-glucosidase